MVQFYFYFYLLEREKRTFCPNFPLFSNLSGIISKLDLCNFASVLCSYLSCWGPGARLGLAFSSLTVRSAGDLLVVVHLQGRVGSHPLKPHHVVQTIVQSSFLVGDYNVLRPEVVGDRHDSFDERQHQVVLRLGAVNPEQDGVPRARDKSQTESVRLKEKP